MIELIVSFLPGILMNPPFPSLGDQPTYSAVAHSVTSAALQYNHLHTGPSFMVGVVGAGHPYLPYLPAGHYNNLNHRKSPVRFVAILFCEFLLN